MRLTLARSEAIIPTLMAGMPEDKRALLILSDDDMRLMVAHLDGQVSARLRDDPKLRAERIDDEMRLFLRSRPADGLLAWHPELGRPATHDGRHPVPGDRETLR